ncbi:MAG: thiamine diphosphokinase [Bacteroidota bacterium]|nr:thiamine diphosphokinase [Bacteroidota bacterium]
MSSNHLVKDDQEPALLIANGERCSQKLVDELLAWGPFVLMLDGAIQFAEEYKIMPDVLLGDFDDNFRPENFVSLDRTKIVHAPNQNKTDLEKGLDYLLSKNIQSVNILWANGQRTDHFFNNYSTIVKYNDSINISIVDDYCKSYLLPKKFKKFFCKGSKLSLIPAWRATGVFTQGLKYNMTNVDLELGIKTSSSNESIADGFVEISFDEGNLWLMECQD